MKTAAALALLGALLAPTQSGASPKWTRAHAKAVLTQSVFFVTDETQADRPDYQLSFSKRASRSLRVVGRRFVFSGLAHDTLTDRDVPVRFTFVRPGRVTRFQGPAADTTQPSVQVTWPDGKTESWNSVPIDQWGVLRQGTGR